MSKKTFCLDRSSSPFSPCFSHTVISASSFLFLPYFPKGCFLILKIQYKWHFLWRSFPIPTEQNDSLLLLCSSIASISMLFYKSLFYFVTYLKPIYPIKKYISNAILFFMTIKICFSQSLLVLYTRIKS